MSYNDYSTAPKLTFEDCGIYGVDYGYNGNQRLQCPKCTPTRKHQYKKDLSVDAVNGVWFCHHCGSGGSLTSGWDGDMKEEVAAIRAEARKMEKQQAVQVHNKEKTISSPEVVSECSIKSAPQSCRYKVSDKNTLSDEDIQWFMKNRGLSEDTLTFNGVIVDSAKFIPDLNKKVSAYGFPYHDKEIDDNDGLKIVNIKWRTKEKAFVSEKGCGRYMYRWYSLYKDDGKPVESFIITEGELDALSAVEAGFDSVTSVPDGAPNPNSKNTNIKLECLSQIEDVYKQASRIILAVDNDEPGKYLCSLLVKKFGASVCYTVEYPEDCKDLNDVLVKYGKTKVCDVIGAAKPIPVEGIVNAADIREDIFNFYDNGSDRGVSTGWEGFDKLYSVKRGEMNIVTGIPSHGKSSFVDAMLVNIAKREGWCFAIFSPENYPLKRHIKKYIEIYAGVPFFGKPEHRILRSLLPEYISWVDRHFKFIGMGNSEEDMTLDNILAKIAVCVSRYDIKGFVLDPWNEIEHNRPAKWSETEYISSCLSKIRRFARSYNVSVWLIAHPAKQLKKNDGTYAMPSAYDISGSAHWRNKADNVLCVHREDLQDTTCIVETQKIKFREVGRNGQQYFTFNMQNGRYTEIRGRTSDVVSSN